MEDEFGYSQKRVVRLLKRKARLESRYPTAGPARQKAIKRRLHRIGKILAKIGYTSEQEAISAMMAASGIDGVGGLEFQAMSPPGLGRLVRLPFYPTVANADTISSGGVNVASNTNPIFIEDFTNTGVVTTTGQHILRTPAVSWALLRVVGFECIARRRFDNLQMPGPVMLVSDLKLGGGMTLFTHEEWADARMYSANNPDLCGLRDYPLLESPNVAEVIVQAVSDHDDAGTGSGLVADEQLTFSCALLVEILIDQNNGAHVPGAYARKGAMVRQGGAYAG